jgi:signal transduction histidine kinase
VLNVELVVDLGHEAGRRPTRLLGQIEDTVYRLVQEGLNNASWHGGTDRATVEVREVDDGIRIRIEDEGEGFDPDEKTDGFGLVGMSERVALAGGALEVKSAPAAGTAITATLPAQHRRGRRAEGATGPSEGDGLDSRAAEGS